MSFEDNCGPEKGLWLFISVWRMQRYILSMPFLGLSAVRRRRFPLGDGAARPDDRWYSSVEPCGGVPTSASTSPRRPGEQEIPVETSRTALVDGRSCCVRVVNASSS